MDTMVSTTFKATLISITFHVTFVMIGSLAIYQSPIESLELRGVSGKNTISLSNISFINSSQNDSIGVHKKLKTLPSKNFASTGIGEVSIGTALATSNDTSISTENSFGGGHDFDQGHLFFKIKEFFEARLGLTLNISVEQLIKIKVTLGENGEILSADLVQGRLEFQALKKILSVAKNIPLKAFWKSSLPYPRELIIPLILTPN